MAHITSKEGLEVVRKLGEGSFSNVYEVKDPSTQNHYALKVVSKMRLFKCNRVHQAFTEKSILNIAAHPNVVKLHNTFQDTENLYFLLDHCDRGDLRTLLNSTPEGLDLGTARRLFREIVLGLQNLHSHRILYRDLKPENILLQGDGMTAKLCDFGTAAQLSDDKPFVAGLAGSAAYLPPELLSGNPKVDLRGDLWSLGCVLYALFHGQSPFHDNVDYHALIKVKSGVVAYPSESNVNAEAKDLIGKLLAPNPDDRPTIADALQHDFLSSA